MDRLGAFLCGLSNFNTISSQADCDEKGYLEDGYYPSYSDKTVERWSVIGGLLVRCGYWNGDWFIKAGGGIGTRNLYFIANNGNHYRNRYYSKEKTFEGLLGVQFHFGQFVITIDGTTNFNTSEIRIGAGVAF